MHNPSQCLVDIEWHGSAVTLRCAGVVDMLTIPDLQRGIDQALAQNPTAVVVDLTLIDFISSRGMCTLLDAHERCSPAIGFAVVAEGPATLRPMRLMGLTDILSVRASVDDALSDIQG
jgi:anti-sigma B factor antagonist